MLLYQDLQVISMWSGYDKMSLQYDQEMLKIGSHADTIFFTGAVHIFQLLLFKM